MTFGKIEKGICSNCKENKYITYKRGKLCKECNQHRLNGFKLSKDVSRGKVQKEVKKLLNQAKRAKNDKLKKEYKGKTVAQLKKKLWKYFSDWVKQARSEDGINCTCISCGKNLQIGTIDCQAGHFLPKKAYPFLYFHEDNVFPQCSYCNSVLQGNQIEYEKRLKHKIGKKRLDYLHENKRNTIKWNRSDLIELIERYKTKLSEL